MKLTNSQLLNFVLASLLFALVFFDIFAVLPSLYGTSYYLFSLPYGSAQQTILWVSLLIIAIDRLFQAEGALRYILKIVSNIIGIALLIFISFRLFRIVIFIFGGHVVVIHDDISSVFAETSIALITLAILWALIFISLIQSIQQYKHS